MDLEHQHIDEVGYYMIHPIAYSLTLILINQLIHGDI